MINMEFYNIIINFALRSLVLLMLIYHFVHDIYTLFNINLLFFDRCLICITNFFFIIITVWAISFHVDGETEAGWILFVPSSSVREARRGVLHNTARRHNHGFLEWILRSSPSSGLLRGPFIPNGIGHYHENDITGNKLY